MKEGVTTYLQSTQTHIPSYTHTPNPKYFDNVAADHFHNELQYSFIFCRSPIKPGNITLFLKLMFTQIYFACELSWMCQNFPLPPTVIKLPELLQRKFFPLTLWVLTWGFLNLFYWHKPLLNKSLWWNRPITENHKKTSHCLLVSSTTLTRWFILKICLDVQLLRPYKASCRILLKRLHA